MDKLDEDTLDDFLERFQNFYDSVVTSFAVESWNSRPAGSISLTIQVIDHSTRPPDWCTVTLTFREEVEFRIDEPVWGFRCLPPDGIRANVFDDKVFLDLATPEDHPRTLQSFRASGFYIGGRSCRWRAARIDSTA